MGGKQAEVSTLWRPLLLAPSAPLITRDPGPQLCPLLDRAPRSAISCEDADPQQGRLQFSGPGQSPATPGTRLPAGPPSFFPLLLLSSRALAPRATDLPRPRPRPPSPGRTPDAEGARRRRREAGTGRTSECGARAGARGLRGGGEVAPALRTVARCSGHAEPCARWRSRLVRASPVLGTQASPPRHPQARDFRHRWVVGILSGIF